MAALTSLMTRFSAGEDSWLTRCRSNGPRVASPEAPSLSRLWAGFAPRHLISKRHLPVAGWLNGRLPEGGQAPADGTKTDRLLAEGLRRGRRLTGGRRAPSESVPSSRGQDRARLQHSPSPPNPGLGVATVPRTGGDLRTARHCCHSILDVALVRRSPVPTTACRYGLQAAGPTRQREPGRRHSLTSRTQGRPISSRRPAPPSRSVRH